MTNPFSTHASNLFADRDSIDHALAYAADVINGLSSTDKAAAWTGLMVVVNTAAKLWPEAPESNDAAQVRAALAARAADALPLDQLVAHQLGERIAALDARLSVLEVVPVTPEDVAKAVEAWADENLDGYIENWADTYLDDRIESWTSSNLDIEDDVQEEVRKVLRDVTISLDL